LLGRTAAGEIRTQDVAAAGNRDYAGDLVDQPSGRGKIIDHGGFVQ